MKFHELDAQARASSAPKVTTAANSSSAPPTRLGWWMRRSCVSWKSRSVSSGRRRSSSQRGARSFSLGRSSLALPHSSSWLGGMPVPVEDLLAGPHLHARTLQDVLVELLEVADAVRHAGDVGMHADRHDAHALLALGMEAVELIDAAAQPFFGGMVLEHHHRDVVQVYRVGQRDDRPGRRLDLARLVVEHPVGDILDARLGEVIDSFVGFGQARTLPAARLLSGKRADRLDRLEDFFLLILQMVHRPLDVAVPHEFPARLESRARDPRIALAN